MCVSIDYRLLERMGAISKHEMGGWQVADRAKLREVQARFDREVYDWADKEAFEAKLKAELDAADEAKRKAEAEDPYLLAMLEEQEAERQARAQFAKALKAAYDPFATPPSSPSRSASATGRARARASHGVTPRLTQRQLSDAASARV